MFGTGAPFRTRKKIHFFAFTLFLGFATCLAAAPRPATAAKAPLALHPKKPAFRKSTTFTSIPAAIFTFIYLGTEQWSKIISQNFEFARQSSASTAKPKMEDREKLEKVFDVITAYQAYRH